MKTRIAGAILLLSLLGTGTAMAAQTCGPAFDGIWEWEGSDQGQYTKAEMMHVAQGNFISAQTHTGTIRGAYLIANIILDMRYDNHEMKNLSARQLGKSSCELSFGRPSVKTDTYGVASGVLARKARLTVQGRTINWCWQEQGHQFGNCIAYRKTD